MKNYKFKILSFSFLVLILSVNLSTAVINDIDHQKYLEQIKQIEIIEKIKKKLMTEEKKHQIILDKINKVKQEINKPVLLCGPRIQNDIFKDKYAKLEAKYIALNKKLKVIKNEINNIKNNPSL